jgi:hypothetical protein
MLAIKLDLLKNYSKTLIETEDVITEKKTYECCLWLGGTGIIHFDLHLIPCL